MTETVLVTGGAGYIGSHCCKRLAAQGYTPVCYDNFATGRRDFVRFGPLVEGDVRDRRALIAAFRQCRPRYVMHFAALVAVEESTRMPLAYYDVNVCGTVALLEACRQHGVHHLVFSSTAAVYGDPPTREVRLDTPTDPINPYGHSKLMSERIIRDYAGETRMGVTIFRYFNASGADPGGEVGMRFDEASHIIPRLLKAAADDTEFTVYGDDYPTPDGTCVRDYIHVSDIASAHVAALQIPPETSSVRTYNLGVGRGYSVREVIEAVSNVTDCALKLRVDRRRPGDAAVLIAGDTGVVRAELGWEPRHPAISEIVSDGWAWYRTDRRTGGRR